MNVTLYRRAANGAVLPELWRQDRLTRADLADVERIVISADDQIDDDQLDIELPSVAARWNADLTGVYDDYD